MNPDLTGTTISKGIKVKSQIQSTAYENVTVDPANRISSEIKIQFLKAHEEFKDVFDDSSIGLYNGHSGPLEVKVHMGPSKPPQRKGRMPLYNSETQEEYQEVCDM